MEKIACTLWSIWLTRNSVVCTGKKVTPTRVNRSAITLLRQWQAANTLVKVQNSNIAISTLKWKRPPGNWWKCNVDASTASNPPHCGYGCIIRDSQGKFVAALNGVYIGCNDPKLAKAYGVREALSWLKKKQAENVIVEIDYQGFVQCFHRSSEDSSLLGLIVDDCKTIAKDIESCKVEFVRRTTNGVAYKLARVALSMSGKKEWT